MLPKTAKDTKDSQSRLDFFLMKDPNMTVKNCSYPCPRKYHEAWQTLLNQHLASGRICPFSSPHASPAFCYDSFPFLLTWYTSHSPLHPFSFLLVLLMRCHLLPLITCSIPYCSLPLLVLLIRCLPLDTRLNHYTAFLFKYINGSIVE